jgi:hypothetical protein
VITKVQNKPLKRKQKIALVDAAISAELTKHGFTNVGPKKWVRSHRAPIREIIWFVPHSWCLMPIWGFSLDWVPHIDDHLREKVRWHDNTANAILDLRYDPIDYCRGRWDEIWGIRFIDDRHEIQRSALNVLPRILQDSVEFFRTVQQESDLLLSFESKCQRPAVIFSFGNYIHEHLAYAFTLARFGQLDEGLVWLHSFTNNFKPIPRTVKRELEQLLRQSYLT